MEISNFEFRISNLSARWRATRGLKLYCPRSGAPTGGRGCFGFWNSSAQSRATGSSHLVVPRAANSKFEIRNFDPLTPSVVNFPRCRRALGFFGHCGGGP